VSVFSTIVPEFEAFLDNAKNDVGLVPGGAEDPRNTRFIPRNFLIDERIDEGRATNYAAALPSAGPASFAQWNAAHNRYLDERVFKKPIGVHNYHSIDMDDEAVCPETFRAPLALTAFQGTDLDTDFIRMMAVSDLAWLSGGVAGEIYELGKRVVEDPTPSNPSRDDLAAILDEAFHAARCDHRPIFAAFYEDFLDALRDPDSVTWPNQVRDRLGLYHCSQWSIPFPRPVFLFRYAVRELPHRRGDPDRRPLALPGVLDHRFAPAFCPAPKELRQGQLSNLNTSANEQPAREVLHLSMPLQPKHLFRVGMVTTPVPDYLGPTRRDHLIWLRLLSGREDYAAATDHDLV
jgi:hypothetical protein